MDKAVVDGGGGGGEWTCSKKVVNHKTRQVETRIQRQLIMEDGKVIADSGPQVTIRTKEDNWTEESEDSAKKGLPGEVKSIESGRVKSGSPSKVPISVVVNGSPEKVISEKVETKNTTREAKHERFQYHDESISELTGFDLHQKALGSPNDLITINCDAVNVEQEVDIDQYFNGENKSPPPKGKLTHYSSKSHKVTDKEEVKEISKLGADGEITTETVRTSHHEEISDDEEPEENEEKEENEGKKKKITDEISRESSISKECSSEKITYSKKDASPITSSPDKGKASHQLVTHRRHLDHHHPSYDFAGKADHTNKWIESHFGSSDSSQHDHQTRESGLNSSSSGSVVDRRGRPRQRINPSMSQSYDEAYYSNTIGGNQSQSNNSSSKLTSTDKPDYSTSSPSPTIASGKKYLQLQQQQQQQFNKQRQSNTIGYTKLNEIGIKPTTGSGYSNNSLSESSVSSFIQDYHHSSEGSLSPSALNNNNNHRQPATAAINKRWSSYQLVNSKPIKSSSISPDPDHNYSRNLIIKVKRRVPKEDASVQASLSDEEPDHYKEITNYGKQSSNPVNHGFKDVNNNNVNHSKPMKTYYFGESVEPDYPVNQGLKSTVDYDSDDYRLSSRLPVNDLLRTKLIQPSNRRYLIEQFNSPVYHDEDEKFSRSLNCLNDQRLINGSLEKQFDPSSRTDLFQTRDYGSLSNWRSTINLRSNGLTTIDGPLNGNRSKDDLYTRDQNNNYIHNKPNYRESLNRFTLRKGHLGSVNNLIEKQLKVDQIPGTKSRGLSPIQERKHSLALDNNLNLLLSQRPNYWQQFNPLTTPINQQSNNYNPKGTYKVNHKHRVPIQTYFKAH